MKGHRRQSCITVMWGTITIAIGIFFPNQRPAPPLKNYTTFGIRKLFTTCISKVRLRPECLFRRGLIQWNRTLTQ